MAHEAPKRATQGPAPAPTGANQDPGRPLYFFKRPRALSAEWTPALYLAVPVPIGAKPLTAGRDHHISVCPGDRLPERLRRQDDRLRRLEGRQSRRARTNTAWRPALPFWTRTLTATLSWWRAGTGPPADSRQ